MLNFLRICVITLFFSRVSSDRNKQEPFNFNFQQNDYIIKPERVELVSYNKDYVQYPKVVTFKYNRTCTAFNASLTLKVDMGNQLEAILQAYKFASNEYRLFPMRFQLNVCDALSKNVFGIAFHNKCGNFSGCPLMKGKQFNVCNFTPDSSKFPPLIPTGRYMFEIQGLYLSVEALVARAYCEVTRPFTGK